MALGLGLGQRERDGFVQTESPSACNVKKLNLAELFLGHIRYHPFEEQVLSRILKMEVAPVHIIYDMQFFFREKCTRNPLEKCIGNAPEKMH